MMDSVVYTRLHDILTRASRKAYNLTVPEIALQTAIIVQAVRDQDTKYFFSEAFEQQCNTCKLNSERIASLCLNCIKTIDKLGINRRYDNKSK